MWFLLSATLAWLPFLRRSLAWLPQMTKKQVFWIVIGFSSVTIGFWPAKIATDHIELSMMAADYFDVVDGSIGFDDFLCWPEDPEGRALRAPKTPQLCYETGLPQPFLNLACDFEAHEYCSGTSCDFWFNAVKSFLGAHRMTVLDAAADSELTIKLVNYMLDAAHTKFLASFKRLDNLAARDGKVDQYYEEKILDISLQTILVLMWYCDESRTRPMKSQHSWGKTFSYLAMMESKLREHSTNMRCLSAASPVSSHCYEIEEALLALEMLLVEFGRRIRSGLSQCPSVHNEIV